MKNKKGFTLVEIMIVVAIIGLLAAVGIPSIMNAMSNAEDRMKEKNIASVEKAIGMLMLPNSAHTYGASLEHTAEYAEACATITRTDFGFADIAKCIQGVTEIGDLTVGQDAIVIGDTASDAPSY